MDPISNGHQIGAAAASDKEERDSAVGFIVEDKPRSEAEAEVVEVVPAADADKGKSVAATADDGQLNVNNNIAFQQERRKRTMKRLFRALEELMPHVPPKSNKVTILGEAIQYIRFLEDKAAMLWNDELEQALTRQAAAACRGQAFYSSVPLAIPQGRVALSSWDVPPAASSGGLPVPPAAPAVLAPPIRFRRWRGRNVVLIVSNNNAYFNVCAPRHAQTLTMVMSVLDNHGIDVITVQVSSDTISAEILIFAHVNGADGENRSSEEVYQRAMSEIMLRLTNDNDN